VQAVPDQAPDIELVIEDAGAALAIAIDRRGTPFGTTRSGDPVVIKRLGDRTGRLPGGKILEDAQDNLCFDCIDAAPAASRFPTGIDRPNDVGSSFLAGSAAWNASISA
jgi:hypothetical protein